MLAICNFRANALRWDMGLPCDVLDFSPVWYCNGLQRNIFNAVLYSAAVFSWLGTYLEPCDRILPAIQKGLQRIPFGQWLHVRYIQQLDSSHCLSSGQSCVCTSFFVDFRFSLLLLIISNCLSLEKWFSWKINLISAFDVLVWCLWHTTSFQNTRFRTVFKSVAVFS